MRSPEPWQDTGLHDATRLKSIVRGCPVQDVQLQHKIYSVVIIFRQHLIKKQKQWLPNARTCGVPVKISATTKGLRQELLHCGWTRRFPVTSTVVASKCAKGALAQDVSGNWQGHRRLQQRNRSFPGRGSAFLQKFSQFHRRLVPYVRGRTLGRDRPRVRRGGEVVAKQDLNVSSRPKPQSETNHKGKLQLVSAQSSCAQSAPEVLPAGRNCTRRHREPPPICVYAESEQADNDICSKPGDDSPAGSHSTLKLTAEACISDDHNLGDDISA